MYQIGIMGSAADLNYNDEVLNFAKELGKLIAKSNNILVY
jgi:predicted Rossmann-fold nucleotide-binding protein